MCVCVCECMKEIYLKDLANMIMEAGQSKVCKAGQ